MNFDAHMRLGSLEILAALVAFGVAGTRLRPFAAAPRFSAVDVSFSVRDAPGLGSGRRSVRVRVAEGSPAVAGRSSTAQIPLLDPEVSRRHARFDLDRGVLYVSDCGSSNGTFLNGKRVADEGIEVIPGDDVDVGNTRMTLTTMEPAQWT